MKQWLLLDTAAVDEDPATLRLFQRDDAFSIRLASGGELMNSNAHGSEQALATLVCAALDGRRRPRVLIGGLGLGYTLRAALDALASDATVVVAELFAAVVTWNSGPLAHLAGHPLQDPRVKVVVADVADVLRASAKGGDDGRWDAVLLDVDNGPDGLTTDENRALYSDSGLRTTAAALRSGGKLGVWSAKDDRQFTRRLAAAGLAVETHTSRARQGGRGSRHTLFVGTARRGALAKPATS